MSNTIQTAIPEVSHPDELPEILTVDEAAEFLRLNRKTVYAAIQRNVFPGARRFGTAIRIRRDEMLRWFAGQAGVSLAKKGGVR